MHIQPIFTNFLAIEMLDLDNKSIEDYCLKLQSTSAGRQVSNAGGWQSSDLELTATELKPLVDAVVERFNTLHEHYGFTSTMHQEISNAWANINQKGDYNLPHTHAGNFFSAVYYVKCDEQSGPIEFMSPLASHAHTIDGDMIQEFNEFNSNSWNVAPHAGKLIIFPSWLVHYVHANASDNTRISIAFNSKICTVSSVG